LLESASAAVLDALTLDVMFADAPSAPRASAAAAPSAVGSVVPLAA
jgi:hypothetical protein